MSPEKLEQEILSVDWYSLSDEEKTELLSKQAVYIDMSRKFIHVLANHGTDVRNLITAMSLTLILNFFNFDNKEIILAILGAQIINTLVSKANQVSIIEQLENARKNYINALRSKKKHQ